MYGPKTIILEHFQEISSSSKPSSVVSPRTTVVAVAAFLDAFQKVADLATNSRGTVETCLCWCGCFLLFMSHIGHFLGGIVLNLLCPGATKWQEARGQLSQFLVEMSLFMWRKIKTFRCQVRIVLHFLVLGTKSVNSKRGGDPTLRFSMRCKINTFGPHVECRSQSFVLFYDQKWVCV